MHSETSPGRPQDQQLAGLRRDVVLGLVAAGFPLTLRELAVAAGYGYSTVRGWKGDGLPLLSGKVAWDDFLEWKRARVGLLSAAPARNGRPVAVAHFPAPGLLHPRDRTKKRPGRRHSGTRNSTRLS